MCSSFSLYLSFSLKKASSLALLIMSTAKAIILMSTQNAPIIFSNIILIFVCGLFIFCTFINLIIKQLKYGNYINNSVFCNTLFNYRM